MNYTVDIIDTQDASHILSLEYAQADSLLLRWNGGQDKDSQTIVGSDFMLSMEVNVANATDGHFRHLFTGDETRYKVLLYLTDTPDTIVWTGFLLPDRYSEPYVSGSFYPKFEAVDGLGRLKGKTLADNFYTEENSVIAIIAACLAQTGLELLFNFAPAIQNTTVPDYNAIYLSGTALVKSGKFMDCYTILDTLLFDMVCVLYQSENQWWVEGINQRHLGVVNHKQYAADGSLIQEYQYTKLKKNFNGLFQPEVTVVPAYNTITVNHDREPQQLPETIVKESNDNWAIGQGVEGDISPTHWFGHDNFYAKALSPNYGVVLPTSNVTVFNGSKYISLKKKIHVKQFDKFVFSAKFKSEISAKIEDATTPNGFKLYFTLSGNLLYLVERTFEDTEINIDFDLFINQSGLLDLNIVQPYFGGTVEDNTFSSFISIEKMELKVTGFIDELIVTDVINEDFSKNKDIDLTFSDDATGFSKAFRLAKLEDRGSNFNTLSIPVLYGRTFQNRNYSVVSLYGANLIADNIETVKHNGNPINVLNVFYNWRNGEEMVVETVLPITTGNFEVFEYDTEAVTGDRSAWEKWTDVIYPIEQDQYNKSVSNVYRRLFINAHERVQYTADGAYKFNDLIRFNYMLPAEYFVTNLTWNLDAGFTDITMIKCVYQNQVIEVGTENIPPLCNAGTDVIVPADFGTVNGVVHEHTTATAFDPDGFIVRWSWAIIEGDTSFEILGAETQYPTITNFLGNEITLQLTVKDNDGATAQDTFVITRQSVKAFVLQEELYFNTDGAESGGLAYKRDLAFFNPVLADNEIITVKGSFYLKHIDPERFDDATVNGVTSFLLVKNGVVIINNTLEGTVVERLGDFEFNYVNGDVVEITVQCFASFVAFASSDYIDLRAGYEINNMVFQQGSGAITGYPVSQEVRFIGRT
jgi:hypothetical protein